MIGISLRANQAPSNLSFRSTHSLIDLEQKKNERRRHKNNVVLSFRDELVLNYLRILETSLYLPILTHQRNCEDMDNNHKDESVKIFYIHFDIHI